MHLEGESQVSQINLPRVCTNPREVLLLILPASDA
jgi:hypothetical protein